ncbi:SrfA family protein [Pseudomonas capsici]|uniref:SrfA family protein n=2 Tax=Pseudomonas capsici TaxID=2810614 RepID=A0ABT3BU81_9PSED|nr:SrfA family protein [Pseudomonas capsici]MCV4266226.1 SrfA family protein [Pseudomonas capsici]MCV4277169.1 SrfA family protein [Pseudomonas capsici]MCV4330887.1 SrfA family protein [Pseudomonas capsici]MCV4376415.1 SrfA family protein [Pseudomonas capsici]
MQGALLRTGKSDEFIAVGETGQPVYKAALQLIAALTRRDPSLARFLAVPKSNEQGSVIDWYSPVQGDVVPWSSASEDERDEARSQLHQFKDAIAVMSKALVQAANKNEQRDQIIFGKLLGLIPHAPAEDYLYLVQTTRTDNNGVNEYYMQPVLTFWGFVQSEAERHLDPLHFLSQSTIASDLSSSLNPASAASVDNPQIADTSFIPGQPNALLRTGKSDELMALGETGQAAYKAALQLISALARKDPSLARFLAVPQSNEQGSVIDWYSPVPGDVVPWSSANEDERSAARIQLARFKENIAAMSQALVQAGKKNGQSDQTIFGKLLGLVSHVPDESYVYLVQTTRTNANGEKESCIQPVLTFWGFVKTETDRNREPLYFLTHQPKATAPLLASTPSASAVPPGITATPVVPRPWWQRFWWLWPLLLLMLALLLFGLLRGCLPAATLPVGGLSVPPTGISTPTNTIGAGQSLVEGVALNGSTLPSIGTTVSAPQLQTAEPVSTIPAPTVAEPTVPESQTSATAVSESPVAPELPAEQPATGAQTLQSGTPGEPLSIPQDTAEGPAYFLNGNYRAGAGIMDAKTSRPLRLQYAFEKGKGNVTIRRPDGVSCTGSVNAAMNGASLGIKSEDQANCTDGSRYDMPQVSCKPGAQSIADCQGNYGNTQFPMSMRRE